MKRILILVMSCNDPFFMNQCNIIKQTWAKDVIEGKYPNIDFIIYTGCDGSNTYYKQNNMLCVKCEDDLLNTYKKTFYTLDIVNSNFEYDYIFRTNTSTYVNVPLLNAFIQAIDNDEVLWTSDLYSLTEAYTPMPLMLYARGNGMILSKKIVNILLSEGKPLLYLKQTDDVGIGNILNSYWVKQGKLYTDYLKEYKHGWYKSISAVIPNNHTLCQYNHGEYTPEFVQQFITMQVKNYENRSVESNNYYELHDIFKSVNYDNIDSVANDQFEYSKTPNIFIGSILGYINYNTWSNVPTDELYMFEINHKANNDAEILSDKKVPH